MPQLTVHQLARHVAGEAVGDGAVVIHGVEQIDLAQPGQITFIRDDKNASRWPASKASAALVKTGLTLEPGEGRALILVSDADAALTGVLSLFLPTPIRPAVGIDPGAHVHPKASIGKNVSVGQGCVIGRNVTVGDDCVLHAHVTVMDDTAIGSACEFYPGVVIRERSVIGDRVILHANVVVGADGFGYQPMPDKTPGGLGFMLQKVPHIGNVKIGSDVEIGAGTCIDRGKFSATSIGDGTKIDNLCQIAHNCRVGRCCVIAGQTGLAGSVTVGDGVMMGGQVAVRDHVTIGPGAKLAACSAVMSDVPAGETWGGYPARDAGVALREHAAMRKLPDLVKMLKKKPV
ncbi:MAG: UDP-3-O-(3-hydroxymyristoyl)glucosamine N-acyltransferase [Phycisphaera sp.]|nr:UDP-3-O-(3-hydroxymyristoyl)glucosamine N-acyltransferase [Phycisphaera sp.]